MKLWRKLKAGVSWQEYKEDTRNMNFFAKKSSGHTAGFLCGRKSRLKIWRSIIGAVLCLVLFCTSIGGDLIAAAAADSIPVIVESERNTKEETPALDKDTESKKQTEEEKKAVYTLHLTHYFRFTVDGKGRNVRTEEKIKLTEKDFKDGVCDLNDFAYDKKQLTVTEAKPLSIKTFDKNHEGGARIVYGVRSGWRIVPADSIKNKGTVLREVFNGELSDYTFVPANVIRINMEYKYSNTGGLAGIDATKPDIVETLPKENADGKYELECSIPTVEGFRIVLNPDPLNQYLVKKPTGNETPEQLKEALERGDFNVDVDGNIIYYRQENPGQQMHPDYKNIYSTEYNQKWNEARRLTVDGDNGYTAMAICGEDHDEDKNHGANALVNPKLKVILTKKQLANALENGLDLTVSYRRNATWYTVNHWVPKELSGLTEEQIKNENKQTKEEGGVIYVLLDTEELQGRVGSTTKASAKTEGIYALLVSKGFSQKLIQNKVSTAGSDSTAVETTVDIYYAAAGSYRVIFDTDYTYIKRQQISLGGSVDFQGMKMPERKGYRFAGWQYLKKDAKPNDDGEYDADDYEKVEKDENGGYTLQITAELLLQKAKLKETGGVPALHLYPIWKPAKTQVTVVLWTEDLTGVDDVQATVSEEGNSTYYKKKYQEYGDAPQTHEPVAKSGNSNYSKAGKFTMKVDTDGSLVKADDHQVLQDEIQKKVKENFSFEARDEDAIDASQFYKQHSFEIMHETGNEMDYSTTTANGDGKTMIYVYFTRNIYTLKFHYYGKATVKGTESNYCVANGTNGFSFAASVDKIIKDGELQFYYTEPSPADITVSKSNSYMRPKDITGGKDMPVPETITIRAKYGADLREVWPAARSAEHIDSVETYNGTYSADMISWATTDGKYRDDAAKRNSSHYNEATVMGLYASMDAEIIADPSNPDKVHHLVAYWSERNVSYYRYNHCYEVPGLDITSTGVKTISLHEGSTELKNTLYLVPVDNEAFLKYGFTDLMKVSYDENTKTVKYDDTDGRYYAVRGYSSNGKTNYYAVARRLETISTNAINKQNPSARTHMTRANDNADHTSKYRDIDGTDYQDGNITCGEEDNPYDLYFYYDRDRYRITYIAPKTNASEQESEVELGHIDLPYGAYVTKEKYAFDLGYKDTNQSRTDDGKPKYLWTYPEGQEAAAVCPDRSPDGTAVWKFKGWGLGPAGVNMQWEMKEEDPTAPQAQVEDNFYIGSSMFLYAIWETPMHTVTFHLNGGVVSDKESIKEQIPANTRFTSSGTIPRPVRDGYTLTGWYKSDENGTIADNAEKFDFDSVIIEDQHVAAKWEKISKEKYSYNIYYVTKEPNDSDKDKTFDKVQIDAGNDKIVESGGESYYVLEKEEKKD